jgi:putative oxygen-independent coproporphyrinogen III oxidase
MRPVPLAVYVHFPWCVRKCPYCDFNSYTLQGELPEESYVHALIEDIRTQAQHAATREVVSVFLGGGTPSLFSARSIGRVLDSIGAHLAMAPDAEITLEANPGTIEHGRFTEYRAAGVNRVSIGAQSFQTQKLAALGRIHSPAETERAVGELRAAGLDNFNLDLMYALPGQSVAEALADVDSSIALQPAHISHYQLTLEAGTVFAAQPPELPDDDSAAEMLAACGERLADAGYARYEVSAYARAGRQSRHNCNYWMFGDYLGIGAGAHGKLTDIGDPGLVIYRTQQVREPRRYLGSTPGSLARRPVPRAELPFEFMLNGLRLVDGFEISLFEQRTGISWAELERPLAALRAQGLVIEGGGRLRTSALGLRFLNNALLHFIAETPKSTENYVLSTLP